MRFVNHFALYREEPQVLKETVSGSASVLTERMAETPSAVSA